MRFEGVVCNIHSIHRNGGKEKGVVIQHRLDRENEFIQRDTCQIWIGDGLIHRDVMTIVVHGGVEDIGGTRECRGR